MFFEVRKRGQSSLKSLPHGDGRGVAEFSLSSLAAVEVVSPCQSHPHGCEGGSEGEEGGEEECEELENPGQAVEEPVGEVR